MLEDVGGTGLGAGLVRVGGADQGATPVVVDVLAVAVVGGAVPGVKLLHQAVLGAGEGGKR